MRSFGYLAAPSISPEASINVIRQRLVDLLRPLLSTVEVDEDWYCGVNKDVAYAIADGQWKSARDHYVEAGFYEDRMPHYIEVDEEWYLSEYEDVAAAVNVGKCSSAQQHFNDSGFKEGRIPYQNWSLNASRQEGIQATNRKRKTMSSLAAPSPIMRR